MNCIGELEATVLELFPIAVKVVFVLPMFVQRSTVESYPLQLIAIAVVYLPVKFACLLRVR